MDKYSNLPYHELTKVAVLSTNFNIYYIIREEYSLENSPQI